ncbi:MAG TPA: hypothetical protein VFB76_17865 [Candidatus Angelobacter sp.]|nr:hypothetical protein [Candidatus Angelobacter sp.]
MVSLIGFENRASAKSHKPWLHVRTALLANLKIVLSVFSPVSIHFEWQPLNHELRDRGFDLPHANWHFVQECRPELRMQS